MKNKPKREPIPQDDVLAWLEEHHPALQAVAEVDREWIWLAANLQGDEHTATRESIKKFGFIYKRNGTHALPSGQAGNWSHSCEAPIGFKRKPKTAGQAHNHQAEPKARGKSAPAFPPEDRFDPLAETETIEHEALAFALG
jgi:hypothetical protein